MAQPDFTLYPTFANATDDGTMSYYYRDGKVYINNSEHKDSLKRIVTDGTDLRWRATRIKPRGQAGPTYTTSLGNTITNIATEDELWVNHNYTGNVNWQNRGSAGVRNSWWYDVDQHREYKVYLVLSYNNSSVIQANTYYDWRVKNAVIEYNDTNYDETAGAFKFTSVPDNPVTVRGRVHFNSSNVTWPTMSAKLYKGTDANPNQTVIATQTIMRSAAVDESVSVEMDLDPATISLNEIVSLAAEVDGTSGQITAIAAPLTVQDYSLEVIGSMGDYIAGGPVMLGGLGQSMDVSDDCNPLLNNVGNYRGNRRVQIIEYSETNIGSGSLIPDNLEELRSSSAQPSSVPESYYTSLAFNRNRYIGSKFTRDSINGDLIPPNYNKEDQIPDDVDRYSLLEDSLGEIPVVSLQDTFLGYFSRIIDPYPTLNGKTAYFVKYLMNDQNNVQDPSLSELGRINFNETFKLKDINGDVTNVQPVIQDRENAPELGDLEITTPLFKVGEFPYPILYSQTSATTFTQNLPLTGSGAFVSSTEVDLDTYVNLAFNTSDSTVATPLPTQQDANLPGDAPWVRIDTPTRLIPSSIMGTGVDNQANSILSDGSTPTLSFPSTVTDNYTLTGTFTMFTTPLPDRPAGGTFSGISRHYGPFGTGVFTIRVNGQPYFPSDIQLNLIGQTGVTSTGPSTSVQGRYNPLRPTIGSNSPLPGKSLFRRISTGYELELHADAQVHHLRPQGYEYSANPGRGDRLQWDISFSIPSSQIGANTTIDFEFSIKDQGGSGLNGERHTRDANPDWLRSFLPHVPVGNPDNARLDLRLLGTQTQNVQPEDVNNVNFPYWDKPSGTTNQIRLISELLNQFHGPNSGFYQGDLPYQHSSNIDFPLSSEPRFLEFGPTRNNFHIRPGDEFRFENDEDLVFTVISTSVFNNQLLVNLDREISNNINLNFFLIRRYESAPNIIITDQQKPYNVPPSASSSPGILLPEYRIDSLETNPDAIVTNLIERNLI